MRDKLLTNSVRSLSENRNRSNDPTKCYPMHLPETGGWFDHLMLKLQSGLKHPLGIEKFISTDVPGWITGIGNDALLTPKSTVTLTVPWAGIWPLLKNVSTSSLPFN